MWSKVIEGISHLSKMAKLKYSGFIIFRRLDYRPDEVRSVIIKGSSPLKELIIIMGCHRA